jgi:hypothetical protein
MTRQEYEREITRLCSAGGFPSYAPEYIRENAPLAEVRSSMGFAPLVAPPAPSRASRPAAASPSAAAAAAWERDLAQRKMELDALAAQLADRRVAVGAEHLGAIDGWTKHFEAAHARAAAAMPGQRVAGDAWDIAFAAARARGR